MSAVHNETNLSLIMTHTNYEKYPISNVTPNLAFYLPSTSSTHQNSISPIKKCKLFVSKVVNTTGHVAQNQGKITNRAQPLTLIFQIDIQQQGFNVNGSSEYTIKK